jgi:hypothetical protein
MFKLIPLTVALGALSAPSFATEWANLDAEINTLNASLQAQDAGGPKLSGWVRSRFTDVSDADEQGFEFDSLRIEIQGSAGSDYGYKVSFDMASGEALLRDAFATFKLGDVVTGKMGLFKTAFNRDSLTFDAKLLFLDRSNIGGNGLWNTRTLGLQFYGQYETLGWNVSAQNGDDALNDEYKFALRVHADLMGKQSSNEGAYGAAEGTNLMVAAAWMDDGGIDDGDALLAEVSLTMNNFAFAAEVVDLGAGVDDGTPYDVLASYLFMPQWEGAIRYEDRDDAANTTDISVAVNYYVAGHGIKWTVQYDTFDSDGASAEPDALSLGLAVSF